MKLGRPEKYTPAELEAKVNDYFVDAEIKEEVFTVTGLAAFLGVSRETLHDWQHHKPHFSDTIKEAKVKIEAQMEQNALRGNTNTAFTIFSLKNNFGWKEKQEVATSDATQETFDEWLKQSRLKAKISTE